ncbi:MAG TPA: hypothetical protein VIY72_00625 [Acidimicrobiales bacterium]
MADAFLPADEGRHDRPGALSPPNVERWSFWSGPPGLAPSLVVHVTLVPPEARASFAAAVRHRPDYAVVLVAADLPMPRRGIELRGPGIWADQNVEEPFERWSLGLEAFGVGVEVDPSDDLEVLLARSGTPELRGDRAPLGWDMEWTSTDRPVGEGPCGYRLDCRVEGELLVVTDTVEIDDAGGRRHTW